MKILISPMSLVEARLVVAGGADILDMKNVKEGSLGAAAPWVLKEVVDEFQPQGMMCSAALGDLAYKPGTAALAAAGAAAIGMDYIKAGLYGATNYAEALDMMSAVVKAIRMVRPKALAVAAGYADYPRFGGVPSLDLVRAAADAGADVAMVDAAIKDGKTLFDALSLDQIQEFVDLVRANGMLSALAGSIKAEHMSDLAKIGPDIVGIRGAVCDGSDRSRGITKELVQEFMAEVHRVEGATPAAAAKSEVMADA